MEKMIEMIKEVEDYIFEKKGVKVKINIPFDAYNKHLLQIAYNVAIQNKYKN